MIEFDSLILKILTEVVNIEIELTSLTSIEKCKW